MFQGLGCSPIKVVRELGSERREQFGPYPVEIKNIGKILFIFFDKPEFK